MPFTLSQAAKASGRGKTTVFRAIKSGRLSAVRDETGGTWLIEDSELFRVFPLEPVMAFLGILRNRFGMRNERHGSRNSKPASPSCKGGSAMRMRPSLICVAGSTRNGRNAEQRRSASPRC